MGDLLASLLVLAVLIGVYLLIFRSARGSGGSARSWSGLKGYGEGAWGIALLSGFAVNDIVMALTGFGATTSDAAEQMVWLAALLTVFTGWWCGLGFEFSIPWLSPTSLVGAFAAILKSVQVVREGAASGDWLLVSMVVALGILFGFLMVVRMLLGDTKTGLAWYTALEVLLVLAGPLGITVREIAGAGALVLVLLQIALPIVIALSPAVILNTFACGVVLAEFYLAFLGLGGDFGAALGFVFLALLGYLVGIWMTKLFSWAH